MKVIIVLKSVNANKAKSQLHTQLQPLWLHLRIKVANESISHQFKGQEEATFKNKFMSKEMKNYQNTSLRQATTNEHTK